MAWATRTLGTPPRQLCQVKTDQLLFEASRRKRQRIMETLSQDSFSLLPPVEKGQKRFGGEMTTGGFKCSEANGEMLDRARLQGDYKLPIAHGGSAPTPRVPRAADERTGRGASHRAPG